MALLVYSRSPYVTTLGQHTIPRPAVQFAHLVVTQGIKGAWTIVSIIVGVGAVGIVGWVASKRLTAVLLAASAFVVLVLVIGSYRAWLAAARFVPNLAFDAQRRVDTLNAFVRSRGDGEPADGILAQYQANMVQEALIDYDRFEAAGIMDDRADREFIAQRTSLMDLTAIIALFQDAADRARNL